MATNRVTWAEVRAANHAAGYHFFSRETMRFFESSTVGSVSSAEVEGCTVAFFVVANRFRYSNGHVETNHKVCLMPLYGSKSGAVSYLCDTEHKKMDALEWKNHFAKEVRRMSSAITYDALTHHTIQNHENASSPLAELLRKLDGYLNLPKPGSSYRMLVKDGRVEIGEE